MTKKKAARKAEQETSAKEPKRLSMKDLDERLEALTGTVEKLVSALKGPEPEPEPEPIPEPEPPPLVEGQTYIFCSGPAKEQKLRIMPGYSSEQNRVTGEYVLIPPEIIDFGSQDEETGPKGFHVTSNLEEVKKIRAALKMVRTREIVEVTGDPAFEHVVQQ